MLAQRLLVAKQKSQLFSKLRRNIVAPLPLLRRRNLLLGLAMPSWLPRTFKNWFVIWNILYCPSNGGWTIWLFCAYITVSVVFFSPDGMGWRNTLTIIVLIATSATFLVVPNGQSARPYWICIARCSTVCAQNVVRWRFERSWECEPQIGQMFSSKLIWEAVAKRFEDKAVHVW